MVFDNYNGSHVYGLAPCADNVHEEHGENA